MTSTELRERVTQDLGVGVLRCDRLNSTTVRAVVPRDQIVAACQRARGWNGRFTVSVGTDLKSHIDLTHVFSFDQEGLRLLIKTELDPAAPVVDSIAGIIPGAGWAERECQDLVGIEFNHMPDSRRLVLADDWPAGTHPLRKDFEYTTKPASAPENAVLMKDPDPDATVLPIGPFYPVLEEPVYFRAFVKGEEIVGCDYRGFYTHRGIEKLADSSLTYQQVPFLAERICGI